MKFFTYYSNVDIIQFLCKKRKLLRVEKTKCPGCIGGGFKFKRTRIKLNFKRVRLYFSNLYRTFKVQLTFFCFLCVKVSTTDLYEPVEL